MEKITVYHYDAFSSIPNKGNPAGIVICENNLSEKQMQDIAKKVGFNETAFVLKSESELIKIRYFTPGHEMNLCGHATIATICCLKSRSYIDELEMLNIETKAGVLPIKILKDIEPLRIMMGQSSPCFTEFQGSIEEVAIALGLKLDDIDSSIPIIYGSTGTWTLLVPIKKLETFSRMRPQNKCFPSILKEIPSASIHPFCLETNKPNAHMHARHFSSPYSGTTEDPITGTASGVMGAYYLTFIDNSLSEVDLTIEQGYEVGRDGEVYVHIRKVDDCFNVAISGTAVYVSTYEIEYC